jgi:2-polyprenyl-3-methyl-5-hydroxy-6-metoxy-1,4-benzoquinol methylase
LRGDVSIANRDLLAGGHYARKQLFSRSRLVAWSHSSRFQTARRLAASRTGGRLLDYGCGDGTFLALVHDLFPESVGADVDSAQLADCAARFDEVPGVSFVSTSELDEPSHAGRYDVVVCMEVLEHCPADVQQNVLDQIRRVAAKDATVIVSVPIEIGLALAAKQAARAFAAMRGASEYASRERYNAAEFVRMLFAGAHVAIPRPETRIDAGEGRMIRFTGHKGFNWRTLQPLLEQRFTIERRLFSPMPLLRSLLNSQVWFVCRVGVVNR